MFFRVIKFYSLGYKDGLKLPIKSFWAMLAAIARIEAEEDKRALLVAMAAQSSEGGDKLLGELERIIGKVVDAPSTASDDFDANGWALLKKMALE